MEPIIRVQNLSKRYRLGQIGARSLREDVSRLWSRLQPRQSSGVRLPPQEQEQPRSGDFWALKGVSFEVQPGEVVGIIGKNGAGKSTLLKILSRITQPTSGEALLKGRVASLLEVGTGFHPELSGRENIFLNGAILGMKKAEVASKFDEIVAFAEVEQFIDTPVKRYSSGMYVRLAFAVAAHLEPEILIVDEVLAVGDTGFQSKCLGKIRDVSKNEGRTVLFVSHNMAAVLQLCTSVILLESGQVKDVGEAGIVAQQYFAQGARGIAEARWTSVASAPGDDRIRLLEVRLLQNGSVTSTVDINRPLQIEFQFELLRACRNLITGCSFYDRTGTCLFAHCDWKENRLVPGRYSKIAEVPAHTFAEGAVDVLVQLVFDNPTVHSVVLPSVISFRAVESSGPSAIRGRFTGSWPGLLRIPLQWTEAIRTSL